MLRFGHRKKVFSLAHTVHMSNSVGGISVTVSDIWFRNALNVQQKCHSTNRTKQSYISDEEVLHLGQNEYGEY